jgi:leucyl aminopeptidase
MPITPRLPACFSVKSQKAIPITAVKDGALKKQAAAIGRQAADENFTGKAGQVLIARGKDGSIDQIFAGVGSNVTPYSLSPAYQTLSKLCIDGAFQLQGNLNADEQTLCAIGWGWAAYNFETYKKAARKKPLQLLWPKNADQKRAKAMIESVCLIRDLINTPTCDFGTDDLAAAAKAIAAAHKAEFTLLKGARIQKEFPMLYAVGKASPENPPQLIDFSWGKSSHPKVTLIGKGIVYDTGGLDLKPSPHMLLMKKDMGGSAHVLALAHLIMSLKLPVRLRVIIPTAENSIDANAFRPGDVLQSRKGYTVEIGNTDAEGRLVVADAITYASEGKPDLMIDFCTLTGHARVALGFDIPALFSNNPAIADEIRDISSRESDQLWPLPLWKDYKSEMRSTIADLCNDGRAGKAGAIHGALFIHEFADQSIDWVHVDCYAWEQAGRPGRPQGGADTGLRAMFAWLEQRYAK